MFLRGGLARQPQNAVQQTLWHMYDSDRLRDQHVQRAGRRVLGRDRRAEAGGRRHGRGDARRRLEARAHHRSEYRARIRTRSASALAGSPGSTRRPRDEIRHRAKSDSRPGCSATTRCSGSRSTRWTRNGSVRESTRKIDGTTIAVTTTNVSALHLDFEPGLAPFAAGTRARGEDRWRDRSRCPRSRRDKSLTVGLVQDRHGAGNRRVASRPSKGARPAGADRRCVHGRVCVRQADRQAIIRSSRASGRTSRRTMRCREWVHFFRGEPQVKNDTDITVG